MHRMVTDADVVVTISTTQATLWGVRRIGHDHPRGFGQ